MNYPEAEPRGIPLIKSQEGYYYTDMTENIELRISQLNNNSLSFLTKRGKNWRIIYSEEFDDKSAVLKREKWLKSGVGQEFLTKECFGLLTVK